jgi:hypothetical protein
MDDADQAIDEFPFHLLGAFAPGLPWKSLPPSLLDKAQPLRLSPNLERQGILLFEVPRLLENLLHRRCRKRFVHRITRLRQCLFQIVSLGNNFREIAAG